mmetsp:Transcript_32254/g.86367  ORF Transcript_32254/g.86367 Transcript_32254/m.86367 type:complete len:692 (-) Transcript_32254:133-2208(-)
MQPSSSLKVLDQIDSVRHALGGLKTAHGNQLFYEKLLSSLPQFVACGPQSAGKSSVIRRVSGIALPEAARARARVCTRIATIIQMRREPEAAVRVCLLGPGGRECWGEQVQGKHLDDVDRVTNLVRRAQDDAIEKSGNAQFVVDHTVLVKVHGPDRHSVTLVDLPGFHTSSDADSKTVNDMVKRYIEMPGTLVMHVVKGDKDYDSTLGNDFMRNHKIDRVTVLTHCDKVGPALPRLQITLSKASETSSMTFAVDGSAKSEADEAEQLQHLALLEGENFDIGARALGEHLEERMRKHLEDQMPIAVDELRTSLDDTTAALLKLVRKPPSRVLFEFVESLRRKFREEKTTLMNDVRELVMKVALEIRDYQWSPEGCTTVRVLDEFDELEPGTTVQVNVQPNDNLFTKVFVTSVTDKTVSWEQRDASGSRVGEPGSTPMSNVYSAESGSCSDMIAEISLLGNDRGMRNMLHVDRQPIITVYMQRFAKHYAKILTDRGQELRSMVSKTIDGVFKATAEVTAAAAERPRTAALAKELRRRLSQLEAEAHVKMDEAFKTLETHNTHPDLVFATNEHYLNDLVKKMVAADRDITSDAGSARHIYHNVRAFLKVQRKQVCETAVKELVRTGVLLVEEAFERLMTSDLSDCHQLLEDEPESVTKRRAQLEARQRVLEQAMALLPAAKRFKNRFPSSLSWS